MSLRHLIVVVLWACTPLAEASVVTIDAGQLAGQSLAKVDRFLGVPYAAPPVGLLRWRAPQPVRPWDGLRSAQTAGSACAQIGNYYTSFDETAFDKPYGSEDCLYLNVWAPRPLRGGRPVLVFFHGGSGIAGTASYPIYDGERLAEALDAVVVTANYRLGVLGSLQSRALHTGQPAEDSGSYFLLDMIAVLDWTRRNCAAFGCDPDNLTLAGQSAGAVAVLGLLRSPLAKGSFARAISFSGIPFSASAQTGQQRTAKLLGELLRQRADDAPSVDDWLTAQPPQAQRDFLLNRSTTELLQASGIGLPPAFVADGHVLMALDEDEADEPAPQVVSEVPLLIGRTDDEMSTLAGFKNVGASAGARWPLVNGEPRDATIHQTLGLVQRWQRRVRIGLGDWLVGRKLRQFERAYAAQLPAVYVYRFAWDDYPEPWRSDFGTLHGLDLPFVFGNFIDDQKSYMRFAWTPQNEAARQRLHEQITSSLRHFVHTGQPSPAASDSWPPWGQHEYVRTWDQ